MKKLIVLIVGLFALQLNAQVVQCGIGINIDKNNLVIFANRGSTNLKIDLGIGKDITSEPIGANICGANYELYYHSKNFIFNKEDIERYRAMAQESGMVAKAVKGLKYLVAAL